MSFQSFVKNEIIDNRNENACCLRAETAGMLWHILFLDNGSGQLVTDDAYISHTLLHNIKRVFKIDIVLNVTASGKYRINLSEENLLYIRSKTELEKILKKPCCRSAFLRGVFLIKGRISDPEKEYRMDFTTPNGFCADFVFDFVSKIGLEPKVTERGNNKVIYLKDSNSIEEVLAFIGATTSSMKLMEIEVEKTVKNNTNRKSNFEQANFFKTYSKAHEQLDAIEKIKKHGMFEALSEKLKFTALLRQQNEDASLNELVEISGLSRSGINHRLNKLIEIAENIED